MMKYITILLLIFTNLTHAQSNVSKNQILIDYLKEIETIKDWEHYEFINKLQADTNKYIVNDTKVNLFEYLLLGIYSGNFTYKRQQFVMFISKMDELKFSNQMLIGLFCYTVGNESKIEDLIEASDKQHKHFLKTLKLSMEIKKMQFNSSYKKFYVQIDSLYSEYSKIPKTDSIYYLYAPIVDIATIWYNKFPKHYKKDFTTFLNLKNNNNRYINKIIDYPICIERDIEYNIEKCLISFYLSSFGHIEHYELFEKGGVKMEMQNPSIEFPKE